MVARLFRCPTLPGAGTQNPIETEGTQSPARSTGRPFYAQRLVDYPSTTEEFVIVERMTVRCIGVQKVLTTGQLLNLQKPPIGSTSTALIEYAVRIVTATREPQGTLAELKPYVQFGASPRASITSS